MLSWWKKPPLGQFGAQTPDAHQFAMPITPYLYGARFDPETKRVLGVALEMVCIACGPQMATRA
jgi:hypothetical protein